MIISPKIWLPLLIVGIFTIIIFSFEKNSFKPLVLGAATSAEKPVLVVDNGQENLYFSNALEASQIFQDIGLIVYPEDQVNVLIAPDLGLGTRIAIKRAIPVTVIDAGLFKKFRTQKKTVKELFQEKGIKLARLDRVRPKITANLKKNLKITIVRVKQETETETKLIGFKTIYKKDFQMFIDDSRVAQKGEHGKKRMTYKIRYENGQEISRKILSEKILKNPQNKIVFQGTKLRTIYIGTGYATWYPTSQGLATCNLAPKGARLLVTNLNNGKSIEVINQGWGLYSSAIIDLSKSAFSVLGGDPYIDGVLYNIKVEKII